MPTYVPLKIRQSISRARASAKAARESQEMALEHRQNVYNERNKLLAVLSCLFPSHLTPRRNNRAEWALCIHSPAGLLAWSLRKHELQTFAHVERLTESHWDGSSQEEHDTRLHTLVKLLCSLGGPDRHGLLIDDGSGILHHVKST